MLDRTTFHDRATRLDPTGTSSLRRSFTAAIKLRLRMLRGQMRRAVVEHDVLGLSQGGAMAYHAPEVKLLAFEGWLEAATDALTENWYESYIAKAWQSGRSDLYHVESQVPRLCQLARQEMKGIAAATVQQVAREAELVLMRKARPHRAYRSLLHALDKVVVNRSIAFCHMMTSRAYNAAVLSSIRASGATRVGIIPEWHRHKRSVHDAELLDFNPHHDPHTGEFSSGGSGKRGVKTKGRKLKRLKQPSESFKAKVSSFFFRGAVVSTLLGSVAHFATAHALGATNAVAADSLGSVLVHVVPFLEHAAGLAGEAVVVAVAGYAIDKLAGAIGLNVENAHHLLSAAVKKLITGYHSLVGDAQTDDVLVCLNRLLDVLENNDTQDLVDNQIKLDALTRDYAEEGFFEPAVKPKFKQLYTGPGSRSSREETPSPKVLRNIERAQARLAELGEDVGVLTAGDELVCTVCEDIAEGAPYTLDEAEGLIPAHPRCRCKFYPYQDQRFAGDYNPFHIPGGSSEGGQFTFGPEGVVGGGSENLPMPGDFAQRLTSTAIISEAPKYKPNSRRVPEIAKEMNVRAGRLLQRAVGVSTVTEKTTTPVIDDFLADVISKELKDGLSNGHSSPQWYSDTMQRAWMSIYKLHPEIEHDRDKKFIFTTALAITSQGETVDSSARLSNAAYKYFVEKGKFPLSLKVADPAITGNFKKMNAFIDKYGIEGTHKIFDREFTVRELFEATGVKVGKTTLDTKVNGSAVLGPKIGLGFYQNLSGNFQPITMDIWFMRAWGRITNTGIGQADMETVVDRVRDALRAEGKKAPSDMDAITKLAQKISDEHEYKYEHDPAYRKEKKPELVLASERFLYNYQGAMVDAPRGGEHRNWMTRVFRQAVDKLVNQGVKLDPASAQATWWHPEQALYKHMGAKVRPLDSDYAKAFERLASAAD